MNNSEEINRGAAAGPGAGCETNSDGPALRAPRPARVRKMPDKTERKLEGPVAWLLGSQLIRSIKGILLYSAYGQKLDPRDWMTAKLASFDTDDPRDLADGVDRAALAGRLERNGGFWFDYISDTGDGMSATYSIAYLCQSDLAVPTLDPGALKAGTPATPAHAGTGGGGGAVLPRGEFLFVGGDTAYHASDYQTLIDRIYNTFNLAHEDLVHDGGLSEDEEPRPIYGVPGNHDYYDQLDGFRRQFRHPALWEPRPAAYRGGAEAEPPDSPDDCAQLSLRGFYRTQEASYLALKLPYGWWFWGLDTETGQIDERQKNFFHQFCRMARSREGLPRPDRVVPPDRLIVATCAPTTAFGQLADPEFFKAADAIGQLGIEQPFLPRRGKGANGGPPDLSETGDARLRPGQCRLDLSGDVHLYARYWGPPPPPCSITPREGSGAKAERPESHSYASVVSGIGGAFHHPSQTYFDEIREQSLYPSEKTSTDEVSRLIFKFWNIWNGGYVFLAGAVIAFLVYFALTVPQSSRQVLNNLPHFGLGLATNERVNPTSLKVEEGPTPRIAASGLGREPVRPLFGGEWLPPGPCAPGEPRYFFGPCRASAPADFWAGLGMALVASLPLLFAAFRKKLYQEDPAKAGEGQVEKTADAPTGPGADARPSQMVSTPEGNEIKPARRDPEIKGEPAPKLWVLSLLAFALFFLGMAMVKPYRSHITPFGSSLLVMLTFLWAGACVALSVRYTEFLFKKAHDKPVRKRDQGLPWFLWLSAVLSVGLGLWSFGQNTLPALLVSDMLFIAAMLLVFGGVVFFLPFSGAVGLLANRGAAGTVGKLLIGVWHYVLQIAVPFILIRKASVLTLLVAAAVIAVGTPVGERLLARFKGGALAAVWVLLGAATIVLPILLVPSNPAGGGGGLWDTLVRPWFVPGEWTGWMGLVPSLAAALVGAVMCCYWFGWYLGVCFAFNGHNNEVGGAARIERFKQFVRFHLTREGLTGYVIAVNDPSDNGLELTPHVVDVFHLRPKA